ncbi:MAG TPA: hypothetical protein VFP84_05515 [Kofleriaceae bacterium]|nr:hypothetical protein [Kofleriaceae bacterium]
MARLGLADLIAAGPRALSRYTGTLFAVFVAQSLVAAACMVGVALVLAQAFAHLPMFDEAVDGDLVALIHCVRFGKPSLVAAGGIVFAGLVLWQLATWFLAGGINGVLAHRPEGRGDTARCFGASGSATYLTYARLALCSLPGWLVVLFVFATGLGIVGPRIEHALTLPELLVPLGLAVLPAVIVLHVVWTIADFARVELTLRHESHDPGVIATYLRTIVYVLRRPVTLVHGALGWVLFALVTCAYAYLAQGHPMYGAEGALLLFVVRQGVALLRMAIRFGITAGQIELGRTRPLPPRRVEVSVGESHA